MPSLNSRRRKAAEGTRLWPFRLMFVIPGILAIFTGLEAIWNGYWWIRGYNPQLGRIGIGPTLGFVFMGALFIFLGLMPWRREKNPKSKDGFYKLP